VANPFKTLQHMWQGVKDCGLLVISIPDKNFSYDRERQLTSFNHLLADYYSDIDQADDDHYIDFLQHVHPEAFRNREVFLNALAFVKNRREHVHVWDSETFHSHLLKVLDIFGSPYSIVFFSRANNNSPEIFSIIFKGDSPDKRKFATSVLLSVFDSRPDLQNCFSEKGELNFKRLLHWAVSSGCSVDGDSYLLKQYSEQYQQEAAQ
jgi:hypothetical protein